MTVWSILIFLFSGLNLFISLGGFVTANQAMSNPLASLQVGGSAIAMLMLLQALVNLGGGVLGIIAGTGLIKVARWGWGVTLAYAIVVLISNGLILFHILARTNLWGGDVHTELSSIDLAANALFWLYPILLIIFLNTATWKNAFAARQLNKFNR